MGNEKSLTSEQLDLVKRFRAAFNEIENHLNHLLDPPDGTSFKQLTRMYGKKQSTWDDRDGVQLRIYADLRNALVHTYVGKDEYLSVPLPYVVERIEQIRDRLMRPEKVIPRFQRKVRTVRANDKLYDALSKALGEYQNEYFSQFPVYDDDDNFCGLLTENGITRWLAEHVVNNLDTVDFSETEISVILDREESRPNFEFVSRNRDLIDVVGLFSRKIQLEAVLITEDGKKSQQLLGIITRWDVQGYLM